jgi:hypothetical protein
VINVLRILKRAKAHTLAAKIDYKILGSRSRSLDLPPNAHFNHWDIDWDFRSRLSISLNGSKTLGNMMELGSGGGALAARDKASALSTDLKLSII